jgi:hypothetical protein
MNDNNKSTVKEIEAIRALMERSSICVSLSGLGGVLVGVCALAGVAAGCVWLPESIGNTSVFLTLAGGVFLSALLCITFFSYRRSRQMQTELWNSPTRRMVKHLAVPFAAGSFLVLKLMQSDFDLVPAASLMVYGIALFSASHYSTGEVRRLAYGEMILGCAGLCFPAIGWICWAAGFGLLHILFGGIMWNKYERRT